jgi:hypothetical protein
VLESIEALPEYAPAPHPAGLATHVVNPLQSAELVFEK